MRGAREVVFSSYGVPSTRVRGELEAAARRGAQVCVRLEGSRDPKKLPRGLLHLNRSFVRDLRRCGADAALVASTDGRGMHIKAAVCDGVAFLDDRNWNQRGDTVVRDTSRTDAAAVRRAAMHESGSGTRALTLDKARALDEEARLLRGASAKAKVDVETESIGYSQVYTALKRLAEDGVRCRLLASKDALGAHERRVLESLAKAGVHVRLTGSNEKMAIAGGTRAWVGSANATSTYTGDLIDWGMRTASPHIVRTLESRFNASWRQGSDLRS